MARYEMEAARLCAAVRRLADSPEALANFESYLSSSFPRWLERFCNTPGGLASEFELFAAMYDSEEA